MVEILKNQDSIKIPSSAEYIADVDEFLESWLRDRKVPDDAVADLAIAVSELVNNAINHGNKKNLNKKVTVLLRLNGGEARVSVSDEGDGFAPDNIPNPVADENLLKEIGRGIFIVKSLMDNVEFAFPASEGTTVTVTKRIS